VTAAICARGVVVRAGGTTLLHGVDLDVTAGEVVVLVGPNGAGKSTLLATIAGDVAPAAGTITLAGHDVTTQDARALASLRAMLRQRSSLTAAFTVLEVVRLGQLRADDAIALAALRDVAMERRAHRSYPTLSGGEQQRVQLARVLAQLDACPTAALLLDEPTAALDLRHQQLVVACSRRAARAGHPVVVVMHDLALAARCADRIVLLADGRVLATGAPADVLTSALVSRAFDAEIAVERTAGGTLVVHAAAAG
jgi:iron complex transport system ATP-binding protein